VSEADNTKVALAFFENLSAGRIDAALDLIADDLAWRLAGKPERGGGLPAGPDFTGETPPLPEPALTAAKATVSIRSR
jgi:ketosteroid isomerase-like protein